MLNHNSHIPARLPSDHPPVLLVVVDAEEEFDWNQGFSRFSVSTNTIAAQPIAHQLIFDKFDIVPTYVIDWPVATTPAAIDTMAALLQSGRCEIGAQLHPWVSPPYEEDISVHNSYAGNLPKDLEFRKLSLLTNAIKENFGLDPKIFKAGRYGVGPHTSEAIARLGYSIDISVVPYTSFCSDGGPDFTNHNEHPFWFGRPNQPLLELPATTGFCGRLRNFGTRLYPALTSPIANKFHLGAIAARSGLLERIRLTPEGAGARDMIRLTSALRQAGCQIFTLTYHSPSLVPGNTPYVRSNSELKAFLAAVEEYCIYFRDEMHGVFMSISELHEKLKSYSLGSTD